MLKKRFFGTIAIIVGVMTVGIFSIALTSCNLDVPSGITLSKEGTHIFPSATVGYEQQRALTVTVKNHSSYGFDVRAVMSGPNADDFTGSFLPSFGDTGQRYLHPGNSTGKKTGTWTIRPKTGLKAGTYTATFTARDTSQYKYSASFDVSFTVVEVE